MTQTKRIFLEGESPTLMKKQKSITQFTVAAHNPIALHNGNSNNRPIAEASSSVNSSNNVFEKPYQPDQTYLFPK